MNALEQLFITGRIIDAVMLLIVAELLVIGRLFKVASIPWPTLLAGLGLLLAWRLSLSGLPWGYVALALTGAGIAHGWDLWRLAKHR